MNIIRMVLVAMLVVTSTTALAEMEYELGLYTTFYESNDAGIKLRVGNSKWPVYGWASYETANLRILGQSLSESDVASFGFGAEHSWDEFSVFLDAGYAFFDATDNETIRNEVVYTQLVNNHNASDARPAPAADPTRPYGYGGQDLRYHPDDARTSYVIKDSFIGRIGVSYQLTKHVKLMAAYRFLKPQEKIEWWDEIRRYEGDGGYWEETNTRDMDAFELGIFATF